ncbi:MAG: DUF362 domain-containing protein [Dehalococcoidales bacterium]|nr:MAG: DUF362 domain-containing protein [Dehalococcoidales bacterium]
MHSKVAIVKVDPQAQIKEIYGAIEDATGMLGDLFDKCPDNGTVLLKPNYGAARKETDVNPVVTHAMSKILIDNGFKVLIGEDPGFRSKSGYEKWKKYVFDTTGLKGYAESIGAQVVELRKDNHRVVQVKEPLYFREIEVSNYALDVDMIVSLAKMKLVNICSVSLSMKNLKGVMLPEWKHKFHCDGLYQGIVDLNKAVQPHIAIIDATFAQDQVAGKAFLVGLLIISNDFVAADSVSARIMGLDPAEIEYIMLAEKAGLGTANIDEIEILGEKLENLEGKYKFSKPVNPFDYAKKSGGNIEIIQGNPCSACLNELGNEFRSLGKYREKLKNITLLVGPSAEIPDNDRHLIFYGNCTRKYANKESFINGCPPGRISARTGSLKRYLTRHEQSLG